MMNSDQGSDPRNQGLEEVRCELVQIKKLLVAMLIVLLMGLFLPTGILATIGIVAVVSVVGYVVLLPLDRFLKKGSEARENKFLAGIGRDPNGRVVDQTVHPTKSSCG